MLLVKEINETLIAFAAVIISSFRSALLLIYSLHLKYMFPSSRPLITQFHREATWLHTNCFWNYLIEMSLENIFLSVSMIVVLY